MNTRADAIEDGILGAAVKLTLAVIIWETFRQPIRFVLRVLVQGFLFCVLVNFCREMLGLDTVFKLEWSLVLFAGIHLTLVLYKGVRLFWNGVREGWDEHGEELRQAAIPEKPEGGPTNIVSYKDGSRTYEMGGREYLEVFGKRYVNKGDPGSNEFSLDE